MTKSVCLLVVALLAILPSVVEAEVPIAKSCRVKNRPPGRCGWCAVETLARHHQIAVLYGVVETHATQTRPADLERALDDAKVSYRVQARGCFDKDILLEAIRKDLGAVVGFRELRPGGGGHIVTLIDLTADNVRIIDPNDQDQRTRTVSLEQFLNWWDGFALVLLKPEQTATRPSSGE